VVIGETCVIGDRVKLYHGVTLAAFTNRAGRLDAGKKRHPTLQDDVTIYPNATILGGDTVIGEGSVIGGNVWLTESVPRYTRVTIEAPTLHVHQKPLPELGEGI
jgi:serine O-acetyltransferase